MSASLVFTIEKSSDEEVGYAVEFLPKDPKAPSFVLASGVVTAFDSDNQDVTSTIVETSVTSVSGSRLSFRLKAGVNEEVYLIKAVATMDDGEIRSAWGTMVVIDPSIA